VKLEAQSSKLKVQSSKPKVQEKLKTSSTKSAGLPPESKFVIQHFAAPTWIHPRKPGFWSFP
jgi:hypothetical protein